MKIIYIDTRFYTVVKIWRDVSKSTSFTVGSPMDFRIPPLSRYYGEVASGGQSPFSLMFGQNVNSRDLLL